MKLLTATANTANITTDYWQVVGATDAAQALNDLTKFAVGTIADDTGQVHFAHAEDITRFLTGKTNTTFQTNGGKVLSTQDGFPTSAGQIYGDNFVYVNDVSNFTSGDSLVVLEGIRDGFVPYSNSATSTDGFVSEYDTVGAIGIIPTISTDLHISAVESSVLLPSNNASGGTPAVILQQNADFEGTKSSNFFQNIANPPTPTNIKNGNSTNAYYIACSGDTQALSNLTEIFSDFFSFTTNGLVGITPSKTITNVADTSKLVVGQLITGAGIPVGTHIASISGSTITLTQATTPSAVLNKTNTNITVSGASIASITVGSTGTVITLSSAAPGGQFNVGQTVTTVLYPSTPNNYQPMGWYGGNIVASAVIGGTTYTTGGTTVVTDLTTTTGNNYQIPISSMSFPYTGTFSVAGKTGTASIGAFTINAGQEFQPTSYSQGFPLGGMKFTSPTGKASTFNFVGTATSGSTSITINSGGTGVTKNQLISGGGIPAGTYITSVSPTTVTISQPTTAVLTSQAITTYTSVFSNDGTNVYLTNAVTAGETGSFTFGYTLFGATAFASTTFQKTATLNTSGGSSFSIQSPLSPYIYSDGVNNPVNGTFLIIPSKILSFSGGLVGSVTSISSNTFSGNYVTDGYIAPGTTGQTATPGTTPRIINASQYSSIAGLTNPPISDTNDPTLFGPISNVSVQAQAPDPGNSITGQVLVPSVTGGAGSLPSNLVPGMAVTGNYVTSGTYVGNPAFVNPPYSFTGMYSATSGSQSIQTVTAPWYQNTDGSYATVLDTGTFSNASGANVVSEFSGALTSGSATITVTSNISAFANTPTSNGFIGYALQGKNIPTGALIGSVTYTDPTHGSITMVDASGTNLLATTTYTGTFGASQPITLLGAEPDVTSTGSSYGYVKALPNPSPAYHYGHPVFNGSQAGTWQVVTTASAGAIGGNTFTVASATGINVGMLVYQPGSATTAFGKVNNYYVTQVAGTTITVNAPLTATLSSSSVTFLDTGYWGTQTGTGNSAAIATTSEIIPSVITLTVNSDGSTAATPPITVSIIPGNPVVTVLSGQVPSTDKMIEDTSGKYWTSRQTIISVNGNQFTTATPPSVPASIQPDSWFAATITNTTIDSHTSRVTVPLNASLPGIGDVITDYQSSVGLTGRYGTNATYLGQFLSSYGYATVSAIGPSYGNPVNNTTSFSSAVYSTSNGATTDNYTITTSSPPSSAYIGATLSGSGIAAGATITAISGNTLTMSLPSTVPDTQTVVVNLTAGSKVGTIVSGSIPYVVAGSTLCNVVSSSKGGGLVTANAYVTAKSGNGAGSTITFSAASTGTLSSTTMVIATRAVTGVNITATYQSPAAQNGYTIDLYAPYFSSGQPIDASTPVGTTAIFWDFQPSYFNGDITSGSTFVTNVTNGYKFSSVGQLVTGTGIPIPTTITGIYTAHTDVRLADTTGSTNSSTYTAGTLDVLGGTGVGAKLTANSFGALTIDGVSASTGDRVLIAANSSPLCNGIYYVTNAGGVGTAWVLTRYSDYDNSSYSTYFGPSGSIQKGDYVVVSGGNSNINKTFGMTSSGSYSDGSIIIGTDAINWSQITSGSSYTPYPGQTITLSQAATTTNTGQRYTTNNNTNTTLAVHNPNTTSIPSPFSNNGVVSLVDSGINVSYGNSYTGTQIKTYAELGIQYSNQIDLSPSWVWTFPYGSTIGGTGTLNQTTAWPFDPTVAISSNYATFNLPQGYGPTGQGNYDIVGAGTIFALPNIIQITSGTGPFWPTKPDGTKRITVGSGASAETFLISSIDTGTSGGDTVHCQTSVTTMQPTSGQTSWSSGTTTFNVASAVGLFTPGTGENLYVVIVDYNPTTLAPNTPEYHKVSSFSVSGSTISVTLATGLNSSKSIISGTSNGASYQLNPTVYVGYPVFYHASGYSISGGGTNGISYPGDTNIWINTNIINGRPLIQANDIITIQGTSTTPPTWVDVTESPSITLSQTNGVETVTVKNVTSTFVPQEFVVYGSASSTTITIGTSPAGSVGLTTSVNSGVVGYLVSGPNVPAGTKVTQASGKSITLSSAVTASSSGKTFVLVEPTPSLQTFIVQLTTPLLNYHGSNSAILLPPQGSQSWLGVTFQPDNNAWGIKGSKVVGVLAPYSGFEINGLPAESGVYLNAIAKASTTEVDGTRSTGFITGDYGTWLKLSNGQFVHGMILSGSTTVGTNPINASESIFLPGFFDNLAQNVTPVDALGETVNGGYTFEPYVYTGSYAVAGSSASHNLTALTVSTSSPGFTIPSSGWIITDTSGYLPSSPAATALSVTGGTSESSYTANVEPSLITLTSLGQLPTPNSLSAVGNQASIGTSITVDSYAGLQVGMSVSGLGIPANTFISTTQGGVQYLVAGTPITSNTITLTNSTTIKLVDSTLSFNGQSLTLTATSPNFGINITQAASIPNALPGSYWPTSVTFNTFASNIDSVNNVIYLSNTALGTSTPPGSFSATYSSGSASITANSLPVGGFAVGNAIAGPGIPSNTTISAINGTTAPATISLSNPVQTTVSNAMCNSGTSLVFPEIFESQVAPEITMDSTTKMATLVNRGNNKFVYQNTIFTVSPADINGEVVTINSTSNTLQKPVSGYIGSDTKFPLSGVYVWEGSVSTESAIDTPTGTTSGAGVITKPIPLMYNHAPNTVVASYQSGDRYFGSTNVGDLESVTPSVVGSLYGTTLNTEISASSATSFVVNPPPVSSTVQDSSGSSWQQIADLDLSANGGIVIIGSGNTQEAVLLSGVSQRVDGATTNNAGYYSAVPTTWFLAPGQNFTYNHSAGEPVCVPNITTGIFTTSKAWGSTGSLAIPTVLSQSVASGASTISVQSTLGLEAGDNLYINDGSLSEYVQIAQDWNGSTTVPLASSVINNHGGQTNPAIVTSGALAISAGEYSLTGCSVTNNSAIVTLSGANTTSSLAVGMPVTSPSLLGSITATGNIGTDPNRPTYATAYLKSLTGITGGTIAVGMVVTGTNIPDGTVVTQVFQSSGTTTVGLNQIPNAVGNGITFTFTPASSATALTVSSITDTTHFTLSANWPGPTSTNTTLLVGNPVGWYVNSALSGTGMPAGAYITNITGQVVAINNFTLNVGYLGTATATSTTTLTESSATWTTNQWAGAFLQAGNSSATIVSNTATALTVTSWSGGTPSSTSAFSITNIPSTIASLPAVILDYNAVNIQTNITATDAFAVGTTISPISNNGIPAGTTIQAVAFKPGNVILNLSQPSAQQVATFAIGDGFTNTHAKDAPILGSAHTDAQTVALIASNKTGTETINATANVGMTSPWYAPGTTGTPTVNTSIAESVSSGNTSITVGSASGFPTEFPTIYQFNSITTPEVGRLIGNLPLGSTTVPYVKTDGVPTTAPFGIRLGDDNMVVVGTSTDLSGNSTLLLSEPTDGTYPDMSVIKLSAFDTNTSYAKIDVPHFQLSGVIYNCSLTAGSNIVKVPKTTGIDIGHLVVGIGIPSISGGVYVGSVNQNNRVASGTVTLVDINGKNVYVTATSDEMPLTFGDGNISAGSLVSSISTTPLPTMILSGSIINLNYGGNSQDFTVLATGRLYANDLIVGTGIADGTTIVSLGSGTAVLSSAPTTNGSYTFTDVTQKVMFNGTITSGNTTMTNIVTVILPGDTDIPVVPTKSNFYFAAATGGNGVFTSFGTTCIVSLNESLSAGDILMITENGVSQAVTVSNHTDIHSTFIPVKTFTPIYPFDDSAVGVFVNGNVIEGSPIITFATATDSQKWTNSMINNISDGTSYAITSNSPNLFAKQPIITDFVYSSLATVTTTSSSAIGSQTLTVSTPSSAVFAGQWVATAAPVVSLTAGSSTFTVSSAQGISTGMSIWGIGLIAGTTVVGVSGTTITLSQPAFSSTTSSPVFISPFPYETQVVSVGTTTLLTDTPLALSVSSGTTFTLYGISGLVLSENALSSTSALFSVGNISFVKPYALTVGSGSTRETIYPSTSPAQNGKNYTLGLFSPTKYEHSIGEIVSFSDTPTNPAPGDIAFNPSIGKFQMYDGYTWRTSRINSIQPQYSVEVTN